MERWWQETVSGQRRGPGATLARAGLSALSIPYVLGLEANLALYEWGLKARTQPDLPVAGIGNITLGGTGKTTTTRRLARDLTALGVTPGIVLRGHGRRSREVVVLLAGNKSNGEPDLRGTEGASGWKPDLGATAGGAGAIDVAEVGDEAAMLANTTPGALVAVGKRRERAITALAERGARVALLDDGFQYFRMARVVDLVLIDATVELERARVFPRGVLREPRTHLRRATHLMITHCDLAPSAQVEALARTLAQVAPQAPIMHSWHAPTTLYPFAAPEQAEPATALAGRRVVAMSGIGNPAAFEGMLLELGATVVARAAFPDHHDYTPDDWARVRQALRGRDADLIVVTEKDLVKLPPAPVDLPPVAAVAVDLRITQGEDFWLEMVSRIHELAR